ncbi:MAG: hypothetical protein ABIF10_00460 [Candidatus Woesearchaeota archaeon]
MGTLGFSIGIAPLFRETPPKEAWRVNGAMPFFEPRPAGLFIEAKSLNRPNIIAAFCSSSLQKLEPAILARMYPAKQAYTTSPLAL